MKSPILKPKELISVLEKYGCVRKRQTGSHLILFHPIKKKIIPVPIHNRDIKKGLLCAIQRELDLKTEELIKLIKNQ